jgi:hypothetical protein
VRRALPTDVLLVAALAALGCGAEGEPPSAPPAERRTAVAPSRPRVDRERDAQKAALDAEVHRLVASWTEKSDRADLVPLEDDLLALGEPALERLLDLVCQGHADGRLLLLFGMRALPTVLARLGTAGAESIPSLLRVLAWLQPQWRHDPQGPAV